ncbi:MAG: glycosyltransferase [Sphingomonadaceae bacterium]
MLWLAGLSLLVWICLALFHGRFWHAGERLRPAPAPPAWPEIAVLIPARDEAETIGAVVASHMASSYPGALRIFLADDGSTDGTADVARAAATGARPLEIVPVPPLPPGWSGKLWALEAARQAARAKAPEARWLLLTDADIAHGPELLERLVARAEAADLALLSVMARLDCRGLWGGLLIPAFLYFFQKLYPFPRVNDPASAVAGAAGGVVLIRGEVLEGIGGLAAIRGALIDDCTLAAVVKAGPPRRRIELVLADRAAPATSLRDNRALPAIANMVARTAYSQLGFSPLKLAGTVVGLALTYLVPPLVLLTWPLHQDGLAALLAGAAWALMALTYVPMVRYCGKPLALALTLPAAALLYTGFTLLSAFRHWRRRGGQWKGRTYAA